MKRIIVFMLALMVMGSSYAQKQKKPKINAVEKARIEGNLGEAKEIIDLASVYEKLKDDGKTWYYRGLVYAALDTTSNPDYQNLSNDPLKVAMESFAKADEMAGNTEYFLTNESGFPVTQSQQIMGLWGYYLNKGVENYNIDDKEAAYKYFAKSTVVNTTDTTGHIYAAAMAQGMEKYDLAMMHYNTLLNDLDYTSKPLFYSMVYIEGTVNDDTESALALIKKAKAVYPEDTEFAKSEINALIKLDRVDEAKTELENAIAADPSNSSLLFTLGVMYEETGDVVKAKEAYLSSVEADSTNLNSRFNVAVMTYNEAIEMIKESNNLGISKKDQIKATELKIKIDESLKEALPHWEKVNELQPNDRTTLETLQYIYTQEKMYDEAEVIGKQLDGLE